MSPLFKVGSIIMLAVMQAAFALEVGNLKMQACRNPIGIDVATPYFGWILASDERGVVQESYEIRVATDRDFQNVVWQSGKVSSSQSVDVLAQGFTTSPRTRYYWQVTVTDNKGNEATSTERAYWGWQRPCMELGTLDKGWRQCHGRWRRGDGNHRL